MPRGDALREVSIDECVVVPAAAAAPRAGGVKGEAGDEEDVQRSRVRFHVRAAEKTQLVMKISNVENQYEIIFHRSVWPEEPREIQFFEKSFEHVDLDFRKIPENR